MRDSIVGPSDTKVRRRLEILLSRSQIDWKKDLSSQILNIYYSFIIPIVLKEMDLMVWRETLWGQVQRQWSDYPHDAHTFYRVWDNVVSMLE